MLELTDEDIPDSNVASVLTLLKIWKERVCPGLIDHRESLGRRLAEDKQNTSCGCSNQWYVDEFKF